MKRYATRIGTALAVVAGAFFALQGGANAADMKSGEMKPHAMKHERKVHERHGQMNHGQMHHGMKIDATVMAHHREVMKMHGKHYGKMGHADMARMHAKHMAMMKTHGGGHGRMDHAAMMKMHAMHHGKMHVWHGHKMTTGMPMGAPMAMVAAGKPMKMAMGGNAGASCGTYMYRKGGACVDARVTPVKK